jgi:hypothetical protein
MNRNLAGLLYAIQHPLGPSRELASAENHQKSAENLVQQMNARIPKKK